MCSSDLFGTRVVGVIVISKLGLDQFDEDDVRLLEVLAGHAAVALENASLYEAARREADRATALLEFSRQLSSAEGMDAVVDRIVELSARTMDSPRASVWLQETPGGEISVRASYGYSQVEDYRLTRMGLDLHVALVGLRQWGDKYLCDKPPTLAQRKRDRRRLVAALVPKGSVTVPIGEAEFVAGPGRDPNAPTWRVLARRS